MLLVLKLITHAIQLLTVTSCVRFLLRHRSSPPFNTLAFGWLTILLFDLTMVVIGYFNGRVNHWAYNLAFPLQIVFILWVFTILLQRKYLWIAIAVFAIFAAINLIKVQGAMLLNTYSLALGGLLIFLLAAFQLFQLYREETALNIFGDPVFWLSIGMILYWGAATPFYAMYNFLWQTYPRFFTVYFFTVSFGFTVVLNLCIIKTLQCPPYTTMR